MNVIDFTSHTVLLPPVVSPNLTILHEGSSSFFFCLNKNRHEVLFPGGTIRYQWWYPFGNLLPEESTVLNLSSVTRDQAGVYQCVMAYASGESLSGNTTVIVQCELLSFLCPPL